MTRFSFDTFIGLTLILGLFLTSCGDKPKKDLGYDYEAAAGFFAADESFHPILDEELDVFINVFNRNLPQKDTIKACYMSEQDAVEMLMKNETWLAFTTRRLTKKERENLIARSFTPRELAIAYDGLAIIANNQNPDSCISIKDFKRVLRGEATKWSDINPKSKLGEIDVVFDNPVSSTVRFCVDSILDGEEFAGANIGAVLKSSDVVEYVEKTPNAIGIIGSNWLNDKRDTTNVTFRRGIRVMAVSRLDSANAHNSFKPYQGYLYNGNYPLVRTIYAITTEPRTGAPTRFANFCRLPQGQMIILRAALLPVVANMNVRQVNVNR
jgi:phosphate transport system substrate-binding protein